MNNLKEAFERRGLTCALAVHHIKLFINNIKVIGMLAYALRYFTRAFWAFPVPSSGPTYGLQPPPALPPNPKR